MKHGVPVVAISFNLWDPTTPAGGPVLAQLNDQRSTGAENLTDAEANTLRLAEQAVRELFRRARIKIAENKAAQVPPVAPVGAP